MRKLSLSTQDIFLQTLLSLYYKEEPKHQLVCGFNNSYTYLWDPFSLKTFLEDRKVFTVYH